VFGIQVIVQIETFEEALAHVVGQCRLFYRSMHKINGPLRSIQNDPTVFTSFKVLFEFLAKFGI